MSSLSLVLDSSAWIEILNDGVLAKACMKELKSAKNVLVPTLVLFEVYKKVASSRSEDQGLSAVAVMCQYQVVDLTRDIALTAADISMQRKLPTADSMVLAHAHQSHAVLVTLDHDLSGIPGVRVLRKQG